MLKEIEVLILGKRFTFQLAGDISPDEFLQIVDYVENKIKKIKNRVHELDSFRLGLLTSINIAEEFFALKKENAKLRDILVGIDAKLAAAADSDDLTIRLSP